MSATLSNNAEGGVDGANVAPLNSGGISGDIITHTYTGSGASLKFSSAVARGALAYEFKTGATATESFMTFLTLPPADIVYMRFAFYMPSSMAGVSLRFLGVGDAALTTGITAGVRSNGQIIFRNGANTVIANSSTTVKFNQWMRIELKFVLSATVGQVEMNLFTEVDSPYPAERLVSPASFNTLPNDPSTVRYQLGLVGFAVANGALYVDDITLSTAPITGPADATQPANLLLRQGAESGTNGTVVTRLVSGSSDDRFLDDVSGDCTYSDVQTAHGNLALCMQTTDSTATTLSWQQFSTPSVAMRFYAYFTSLPPAATEFAQLATSPYTSFTLLARFSMRADGYIHVNQHSAAGASPIWTSASPLSLNTWYRFELFASLGGTTTTGTIQAAYYALDSTTAIDSFSTNTAWLGLENFGAMRLGKINVNAWATTIYIDDMALQQNATGFVGPYTAPPTQPAPYPGIIPHLGWGRRI